MSERGFQIAIDGPVAAGKGTVSKKVADRLGFLYVDTGATYRVATLIALESGMEMGGLDGENEALVDRLVDMVKRSRIELDPVHAGDGDQLIRVALDGKDVSQRIREVEVSRNVPIVAKIGKIREVLVEKQREIAKDRDVVMEGRDITYRVLPEANLKIYLDASLEVRAQRRHEQLVSAGRDVSLDEVTADTRERDRIDTSRETDPLKKLGEAWYLDSTKMSIDEVVEVIVDRVKTALNAS